MFLIARSKNGPCKDITVYYVRKLYFPSIKSGRLNDEVDKVQSYQIFSNLSLYL